MLLTTIIGFILVILGIWGMLTQKNLFKIVLGFSIMDSGIHLIIVSMGYIKGRTAPILDSAIDLKNAAATVVDPIPSALVLTAIVIGLAVTALMLAYIIQLVDLRDKSENNLDDPLAISSYEELKW
ncbi:MAG: cation:proton antiporter subunit C [Candidatus Cloacimonadales bacterium]